MSLQRDPWIRELARRISRTMHRSASITYGEPRATPIAPAVPEPEPVPEFALVSGGERARLMSVEAHLGVGRGRRIEQMVARYVPEIRDLDDEALNGAVDKAMAAVRLLDKGAARTVAYIERGREAAGERIEAAGAKARALQAEADGIRGPFTGRRREALLERVQAAIEMVREEEAGLAQLLGPLEKVREEPGRHPDDWIRDQGPDYARGVAARRELQAREDLGRLRDLDMPGLVAVGPEQGMDIGD